MSSELIRLLVNVIRALMPCTAGAASASWIAWRERLGAAADPSASRDRDRRPTRDRHHQAGDHRQQAPVETVRRNFIAGPFS